MAKAAELDTELVNGLKAAKSKRAYFALILKGSNDGALIVSKTKVPPADIAEAKKKSGGSAVLKGFCQYEEGTYVFETAKQAPATAAQAVKVIAKRDAGLAVKAEFRVSTDPELLADEGDAPATAPPKAPPAPPQADGAEVTKRLNAMTADIKAALAGPNKAQVQALYLAISGQIKNKAFVEAGKGLDELQKLLKQTTPQKDVEMAQQEEPSEENGQAAFDARLKTVGADLLIHLKANPDDRADLTDLLREARDAAGDSDFEAGHALLDRIDKIIIAGKRAARGAEMAEQIPEGAASSGALDADRIQLVVDAWRVARETAVSGAATLAEMLRGSEYDDLHPIADFVDELVDGFPGGLDTTLEDLRSATIQRDTPQVKQFQSRSKTEIKACLDYLGTNANLIAACEQHPLGSAKVAIAGPLKQSLKSILELVK
jgi:hypothetical protein